MLKELLDNVIAINRSTSQTPTFLSLIGQESREITRMINDLGIKLSAEVDL